MTYEDGEVRSVEGPENPFFVSAREYELQRWLTEARSGLKTPFADSTSKLQAWLRTTIQELSDELTPCLVHGDFSATNIMISGDRVTGLLDLGGMRPGHVFMDLSRLYFHFSNQEFDLGFGREDLLTPCTNAFFDAYDGPLPSDRDSWLHFYRQTSGLGFFSCWDLIESNYEEDELAEITAFIRSRLSRLA